MDWNQLWQNLMVLGQGQAPTLIEKVVRTFAVYGVLVLLLRSLARHELAQLNVGDLVVMLLLSNTVQNAIIGQDTSLVGGLFGALLLLLANTGWTTYCWQHPRWRRWLHVEPIQLVRHGRQLKPTLQRLRMTDEDLREQLRRQGITSLHDVAECWLYPDGNVAVTPKAAAGGPPATAADVRALREQIAALAAQQAELLRQLGRSGSPASPPTPQASS